LAPLAAPSCGSSSVLTPISSPYRAPAQSQVETRFNFQYDMIVTSGATAPVKGEII